MKEGSLSIYYNEKKGYLIAPKTIVKQTGFLTKMNPVVTENPDISDEYLGEKIQENLERSRNALPMDKQEIENYKFWQISGMKGFSTFSKKYKSVEIYEREGLLWIAKMERHSRGAYLYPEDENIIKEPLNLPAKALGGIVRKLFFETDAMCQLIRFEMLSGKDETTYLAFLIDGGYAMVNADGIKNQWEKIFGNICEYKYEEVQGDNVRITASAQEKEAYIKSYFFQAGDEFLELFVHIHMGLEAEQKSSVEKEVEAIVQSLVIG